MADFVAVLRKTLDGLESPTQQTREKVYDKARTTIAAKLAAISPPPPAAVIEKQREALEKAIADIEAGYQQAEANTQAEEDPLADFVSGKAFGTPSPPAADPLATAANSTGAAPPEPAPAAPEPAAAATAPAAPPAAAEAAAAAPIETPQPSSDGETDNRLARTAPADQEKGRGRAGLIAAAIIVLLLAGAGYGIWQNKEDFARMAGLESLLDQGSDAEAVTEDTTAADTEDTSTPATGQETAQDDAAAEDEEQKFTQRLLEDGSEVDPGPAGDEPSVGEGTSVAAANNATGEETQQDTAAAEPEQTTGDAEQTGAEAPEGTALPVGQRAIFYEERTSDLQGSAEPGAVVWSLVQESPGGNLPPEPAIRGEATIPEKGLQFKMTIRRNGDKSLPASHIIEMIFITPDEFDGGGIENVLRITFKDSEQSAGNPLLGIPAKISDGFFLLALTDSKADIEANTTMMRRLEWLDIPLVYNSGRRALITMEKGVPGSKVFDEALKAWAPENSG
ncbi:MAG: hypothetical protein AB3N20_01045 [Rhizobiaceae bacterium]